MTRTIVYHKRPRDTEIDLSTPTLEYVDDSHAFQGLREESLRGRSGAGRSSGPTWAMPGSRGGIPMRPPSGAGLRGGRIVARGGPALDQAGFCTVTTVLQMGPPMLSVDPSSAFSTCSSAGTLWRIC